MDAEVLLRYFKQQRSQLNVMIEKLEEDVKPVKKTPLKIRMELSEARHEELYNKSQLRKRNNRK